MKKYDAIIIGSGFGGSLLALMLARLGLQVCVIERNSHPRFAIGESSTPIADMVLRSIANGYGLPWLEPFSRYGTWLKEYPEINCGLKRGFSYFHHKPGDFFTDNAHHSKALMVAASTSDHLSDTQWFRPDFDHFLSKKLPDYGIDYFDRTEINHCAIKTNRWEIRAGRGLETLKLSGHFLFDATGADAFSRKFLGTKPTVDGFRTHSRAVFSHFENAGYWKDYLIEKKLPVSDHPYHADQSALHHVIREGWMWMLRFRDGKLSAGFVLEDIEPTYSPENEFKMLLQKYPSLENLFFHAEIAGMPGRIIGTKRLQRRLNSICGDGWMALNHTGGFVDPLHSTGIAHTLTGIERIAGLVRDVGIGGISRHSGYLNDVFTKEISLIDRLVSVCYDARLSPELFEACSMLYFCCSIAYERQRLGGSIPEYYLNAGDVGLASIVDKVCDAIKQWKRNGSDMKEVNGLVDFIKEAIGPWNNVGLLDPSKKRMYLHTAADL